MVQVAVEEVVDPEVLDEILVVQVAQVVLVKEVQVIMAVEVVELVEALEAVVDKLELIKEADLVVEEAVAEALVVVLI